MTQLVICSSLTFLADCLEPVAQCYFKTGQGLMLVNRIWEMHKYLNWCCSNHCFMFMKSLSNVREVSNSDKPQSNNHSVISLSSLKLSAYRFAFRACNFNTVIRSHHSNQNRVEGDWLQMPRSNFRSRSVLPPKCSPFSHTNICFVPHLVCRGLVTLIAKRFVFIRLHPCFLFPWYPLTELTKYVMMHGKWLWQHNPNNPTFMKAVVRRNIKHAVWIPKSLKK